jgi:hypothetical protein
VGLALGRGAGRARAEPPRLDGDDAERRGVARSPGAAVALFRRRGGGGLHDVEAHGPGVGRDQELDLVEDALAVLGFDEKRGGGRGRKRSGRVEKSKRKGEETAWERANGRESDRGVALLLVSFVSSRPLLRPFFLYLYARNNKRTVSCTPCSLAWRAGRPWPQRRPRKPRATTTRATPRSTLMPRLPARSRAEAPSARAAASWRRQRRLRHGAAVAGLASAWREREREREKRDALSLALSNVFLRVGEEQTRAEFILTPSTASRERGKKRQARFLFSLFFSPLFTHSARQISVSLFSLCVEKRNTGRRARAATGGR